MTMIFLFLKISAFFVFFLFFAVASRIKTCLGLGRRDDYSSSSILYPTSQEAACGYGNTSKHALSEKEPEYMRLWAGGKSHKENNPNGRHIRDIRRADGKIFISRASLNINPALANASCIISFICARDTSAFSAEIWLRISRRDSGKFHLSPMI